MSSVSVVIPYSSALSKNAIWKRGRGGHVYLAAEAKAMRDALSWEIKQSGARWFDGPLWLAIHVWKPDARGDAINVLDLLADGVQTGTGVDDSWYSARVEWGIDRERPRVEVVVSQAVLRHLRICSGCGKTLGLDADHFNRNRSDARGFEHECRICTSTRRKAARAAARAS